MFPTIAQPSSGWACARKVRALPLQAKMAKQHRDYNCDLCSSHLHLSMPEIEPAFERQWRSRGVDLAAILMLKVLARVLKV